VELERGFQKLGLQRCDMKKICCLVAADGVVDVLEFMRTFSWHDVQNVEKAVYEAKLQVIDTTYFHVYVSLNVNMFLFVALLRKN
jgi:hypothetical protein